MSRSQRGPSRPLPFRLPARRIRFARNSGLMRSLLPLSVAPSRVSEQHLMFAVYSQLKPRACAPIVPDPHHLRCHVADNSLTCTASGCRAPLIYAAREWCRHSRPGQRSRQLSAAVLTHCYHRRQIGSHAVGGGETALNRSKGRRERPVKLDKCLRVLFCRSERACRCMSPGDKPAGIGVPFKIVVRLA